LPNDSAGACGKIKGYIYDKYNMLVKTGNFILDNLIVLNNDGTFSTSVFARKFICTNIKSGWYPDHISYNTIDSLFIDLEPDSVLENDIHFKDYVVSVKENNQKQSYDLSVMNYPNPFNSSTNFSVKIPTDYKHKKGFINIFNIDGRKIFSILLSNNATYTWNGKNQNGEFVSSGVYYYQLVLDNTVYKNGFMIFLK
jgi:hypothetical protein